MKKTVVIGLDGACWNLINEWVETNELPNIKKLKEDGCWGDMKSCIPPITCPAWKCYSTGKNPGKLNVFWWEHIDVKNKKVTFPDSKSFKSKELWNYLNEKGIKTGIIGMPLTYPPKKVDGFMVAGGPTCENTGYTYPSNLEKYLKKHLDYRTKPSKDIANIKEMDEAIKELYGIIDAHFKSAEILLKNNPVGFLHVTTFHINGPFQHFFYKGDIVKSAWKIIDKHIGILMKNFDYVIVMSDHGTSPMIKNFFINSWLEKERYLVRKKTIYDCLFKLGFNATNISALLKKLHLMTFLRKFSKMREIAGNIPDETGLFGDRASAQTLSRIDWDKTKVIASPQGPIYINRDVLKNDEEYKGLIDELVYKLEQIKDSETGKNPIEKVYKRGEIYTGKYVKNAPDLIALDSDEYHNLGGIGKDTLFGESKWKGNNSLYGMFMFGGEGVKKMERIENVRIIDLAPTILHIMNVPIPNDMDGRVLTECFEEDSELAKRGIRYQDASDKARIKDKIKSLKMTNKI